MLSVTLLCAMDAKSPSKFLLATETVAFGFLGIKLAIDVCFFFIAKEKIELWVPASNATAFALFDDTTHAHVTPYDLARTCMFLLR